MKGSPTSGSASEAHIYRVLLRKGDDEVEISAPDAKWVEARLEDLTSWLDRGPAGSQGSDGGPSEGGGAGSRPPSLSEHVLAVAPSGGLEHVLAVGYFLERHSALQGGFRRRDVADAFASIRYRHSNPGVPMAAGRRRGLLMDGEEHEKVRLTESAERWVEERLRS